MLPPEYQGRAGGSDLSRMPRLQDTARLWRQCEHIAGRLALEVDIRRNGLHLLELRVTASTFQIEEWCTAEPGRVGACHAAFKPAALVRPLPFPL